MPYTFMDVFCGSVLVCELMVQVQTHIEILHLIFNGIVIGNASFILIRLGTIPALHSHDRTVARFIFPTALIIMLLVLTCRNTLLNLLNRLAVGTKGMDQWLMPERANKIILVPGFLICSDGKVTLQSSTREKRRPGRLLQV